MRLELTQDQTCFMLRTLPCRHEDGLLSQGVRRPRRYFAFMDIADPLGGLPRPIVLDGGLATELERRGADLRDELWSARLLVDDPDAIVEVHRAYVEAGADVVISASYQASFDGFARRGLDSAAAAGLMRKSVELARTAADEAGRPVLVAASVGPFGAVLADGSE